jgi:hypothetical protein
MQRATILIVTSHLGKIPEPIAHFEGGKLTINLSGITTVSKQFSLGAVHPDSPGSFKG